MAESRVGEILGRPDTEGDEYRRLLERLPAIVYACEPGGGGSRYISPRIEQVLGCGGEDFERDPSLWARMLHPDDRDRVLSHEGGAPDGDPARRSIEYRMIARDGRVVWFLDEAVLERDEEGVPVWHGVLCEITELKRAEQELRRSFAQQSIVAQLGQRALRGGNPDALMRSAVSLLASLDGVDAACVWELGEGGDLRLRAGLEGRVADSLRRVSVGRDSHFGATLDRGAHVIVDDWRSESRFALPVPLRMFGAASSLAVTIEGRHGPFGVLDLSSTSPRRFTEQDVHFARAAADVLAHALRRHATDRDLSERVRRDPLTGLPNRFSLVEAVNAALRRSAGVGTAFGLLFIDVDNFKLVNDSLGHHAGDELLRAIAPRLRAQLRPGDLVARFGGDEFGILIDALADEDEAIAIAERVAGAFAEPFSLDGVDHFVTASIGIAVARPTASDSRDAFGLIRDADAAMYRAKERGRARFELFDAEMRASARRRLAMERELRHAVERGELVLHYQPVVSLRDSRITGLEALVRWRHPERGMLDPGEFVAIAEESGMIEAIGRWVQEDACRQLLDWHRRRLHEGPLDISVNLSARQVAHPDLPAVVAEILERTGLDPAHLRLEVTESVLVDESATAKSTLEAVSGIGVRLVLDDFGTGYSSLAYLNRFPFDALKVDRSFVEALGVEQGRTAIVEAIIGMARALSLETIAEGVENSLQVSELRRLGCDCAQGHFFSPALPPEEIPSVLCDGFLRYSGTLPGR